jgi:hypothetical protein
LLVEHVLSLRSRVLGEHAVGDGGEVDVDNVGLTGFAPDRAAERYPEIERVVRVGQKIRQGRGETVPVPVTRVAGGCRVGGKTSRCRAASTNKA